MKYFNKEFFKFFDQLKKNNNKEWFDKNRDTYENEVKEPFKRLTEVMIEKLSKDFPEINPKASKSIFRINRDIRFTKDKAPYKTNVAAVFNENGTTDVKYPGFYMHFGADEILVGGGKYFCDKDDLVKIRQEIYYNNDQFKKLLNEKSFKEKFGTLIGDKNKVLPAEYKEFAVEQPLIANKQWWYNANLKREDILGDDLDKLLYSYYKSAFKMTRFFIEATKD